MESDEEMDYMSDDILAKCVGNKDLKSGKLSDVKGNSGMYKQKITDHQNMKPALIIPDKRVDDPKTASYTSFGKKQKITSKSHFGIRNSKLSEIPKSIVIPPVGLVEPKFIGKMQHLKKKQRDSHKMCSNNDDHSGLRNLNNDIIKQKLPENETQTQESKSSKIGNDELKGCSSTHQNTSSIGLAMMQKMGYKLGKSLGKEGTGILEPISVPLKSDRIGLGAGQQQETKSISDRASDDEVDYMSEDFLSACVGNNDVRPGLTHSYSVKRKFQLDKRKEQSDQTHRQKMRPIREIQEEKMKEALQTPLDDTNKGFAMLQKMGYKSGMSLGKEGTGIKEPVAVNLKSDRIGLGWKQLLAENRKKYEERRKRKVEIDPLEYRAHMSNQHNLKLDERDLRKSRTSCYDLDYKEGITEPPEFWFWPEHTWEEEWDENEDYNDDEYDNDNAENTHEEASNLSWRPNNIKDIFEIADQLRILTAYLRATYFYCIWCCTAFDDLDDMEAYCPGPTRADHD